METITIICQNILMFIGGMIIGGFLQHKYMWLDKFIEILK